MATIKFIQSLPAVNQAKRKQLEKKIHDDVKEGTNGHPCHLLSMAFFTFVLFNVTVFPQDHQRAIEEALIDHGFKESLEKSRALNWCRTIKRLYPMLTLGDGNCLLSAVCLAMWGCPDSSVFLRRLMYVWLVDPESTAKLRQRWLCERKKLNDLIPGGLVVNNEQWEQEWSDIVQTTSPEIRSCHPDQLPFDCLEEIHIFVLANILRRPIVVLSEPVIRGFDGDTMAPNNFSGIYLPLEWEPRDCCRYPICLGFDMNHFCPLVNMKDPEGSEVLAIDSMQGVPLVDHEYKPLQIHFLSDAEEKSALSNQLLCKYMRVDETPLSHGGCTDMVLYAKLLPKPLDPDLDFTEDYIQDCWDKIREQPMNAANVMASHNQSRSIPSAPVLETNLTDIVGSVKTTVEPLEMSNPIIKDQSRETIATSPRRPVVKELSMTGEQCKTKNCKYYSSIDTYPLCHRCFERKGVQPLIVERQLSNSFPFVSEREHHHIHSLEHYRSNNGKQRLAKARRCWSDEGELCLTPGCKLYGYREWSGHCSEHRPQVQPGSIDLKGPEKQAARIGSHPVKSVAEAPAKHVTSVSAAAGPTTGVSLRNRHVTTETRHCQVRNCSNRSSPQLNGFCNSCYIKQPGINTVPCLTEGCEFNAGSTGYCSSCTNQRERELFVMPAGQNAGSLESTCKVSGCSFGGTPEQNGYCSQHHKEIYGNDVSELTSTNILDRLPALTVKESGKARIYKKCIAPKCTRLAGSTQENRGYCYRCYVDKVRSKEIPLLRKKQKCCTQGCSNICLDNSLGLCNACVECLEQGRTPGPPRGEVESEPNSLIESMSGSRQKCSNTNCFNDQGGNMYGLCDSHYKQWLTKYKQESKKNQLSAPPVLVSQLCKRRGCVHFGDSVYKGYCSMCYGNHPIEIASYPVAYRSATAATAMPPMDDFQKRMLSTENKARQATAKCKNLSCDNYANSRCQGYCNSCFPMFSRVSVG